MSVLPLGHPELTDFRQPVSGLQCVNINPFKLISLSLQRINSSDGLGSCFLTSEFMTYMKNPMNFIRYFSLVVLKELCSNC